MLPALCSSESLHHERVWSVHSPPLVDDPGLPLFALSTEDQARVAGLPQTPQSLPVRLGRRFEAHWLHTFTHLPDWQVHAAGLQLRDGRRTVGELDLLVSGPDAVWHLELAIKFYLCVRGESGDETAHWIGPNARDRLDRKLQRMRDHQLPMGRSPIARTTLQARGLPQPDRSAAILRGIRFADWRAPRDDAAGRWCTLSELPRAVDTARVLRRTEWLGFGPATSHDWLSGRALSDSVRALQPRGAMQLVTPEGRRWLVL